MRAEVLDRMSGPNRIVKLAQVLALALPLACVVKEGGDDDDGGDGASTGANMCDCPEGQVYGRCACQNGGQYLGCQDPVSCEDPDGWCLNQGGLRDWEPMSCSQYPDDTSISCSSSSWNPASHVSFSGGVYHVNASWLAGVIADPAPTWTCDNATLGLMVGGGVVVGGASSGELLYVLGLRNNDIPLYINSMPLDDFMDGWAAFLDLYVDGGETEYFLTIDRGGSIITLSYELV